MTDKWDPSIPAHKELAHQIEIGNGIPEIFSVLTEVGDISQASYEKRFREMQSIWGYYVLVVLDGSGKIVGTGALVLEKKL